MTPLGDSTGVNRTNCIPRATVVLLYQSACKSLLIELTTTAACLFVLQGISMPGIWVPNDIQHPAHPGCIPVHTRAFTRCRAVALAQHLARNCVFAQPAPLRATLSLCRATFSSAGEKMLRVSFAPEARKTVEAPFYVCRRPKTFLGV